MDSSVREFRIKQWIKLLNAQAGSGMSKAQWCAVNGIERTVFFRWQRRVRAYLLEHGENTDLATLAAETVPTDEVCLVELPMSQEACSQMPTPDRRHEDTQQVPPPITIIHGRFSAHIHGSVDVCQLTAVLRAMKHAD